MKRVILSILIFLMLVGISQAWIIQGEKYTGTVNFYNDGTGKLNVDGYPTVGFAWKSINETYYEAHYLWYNVPFKLENAIVTSDMFPGYKLVP